MQVDQPTARNERFLLFVGGDDAAWDGPAGELDLVAADFDVVVAVDSGLEVAERLGVEVHHVVGDMDSVDAAALAVAHQRGATVHRHLPDKDATDLELAIDLVTSLGTGSQETRSLHVVGGGGGRLDHLLGDLLVLSGPRLAAWHVTARFGDASVAVVRPGRAVTVPGRVGDQVSLLPVHGDVTGVTTTGLRWPLVDGYLAAGTSRGISNEIEGPVVTVEIGSGTLLALRPGTRSEVATSRPGPYDPTPRPPARWPAPPADPSQEPSR